MYTLLVIVHVLACLALILIVLLQTGKGADMGAAFGGGASQTLFGSGGSNTFLSKLTTGAAIVFMLTCLMLTYLLSGPSTKSIMKDVPVQEQPQGPALPEAKPVQSSAPEAAKPAAPAATATVPASAPQPVAPQPEAAPAKAPADTGK